MAESQSQPLRRRERHRETSNRETTGRQRRERSSARETTPVTEHSSRPAGQSRQTSDEDSVDPEFEARFASYLARLERVEELERNLRSQRRQPATRQPERWRTRNHPVTGHQQRPVSANRGLEASFHAPSRLQQSSQPADRRQPRHTQLGPTASPIGRNPPLSRSARRRENIARRAVQDYISRQERESGQETGSTLQATRRPDNRDAFQQRDLSTVDSSAEIVSQMKSMVAETVGTEIHKAVDRLVDKGVIAALKSHMKTDPDSKKGSTVKQEDHNLSESDHQGQIINTGRSAQTESTIKLETETP